MEPRRRSEDLCKRLQGVLVDVFTARIFDVPWIRRRHTRRTVLRKSQGRFVCLTQSFPVGEFTPWGNGTAAMAVCLFEQGNGQEEIQSALEISRMRY